MWNHALCSIAIVNGAAVWRKTFWEWYVRGWRESRQSRLDCESRQGSSCFAEEGKDREEDSLHKKCKHLTRWKEVGMEEIYKVEDLKKRWDERGGKQMIMRRLECSMVGKMENRQWNSSGISMDRLKEMVAEENGEHESVKKLNDQITAKMPLETPMGAEQDLKISKLFSVVGK